MNLYRNRFAPWMSAALLVWATAAQAQIVIGQSAGFTGPVADGVAELTEGAKIYLDSVNRGGGINGEKVVLVSLDDNFKPTQTAENAKTLVEKHKAVALFLLRGTPHTEAVIPLATSLRVPIVAPSTGATLLHEPVNPWVFNVRTRYRLEAEQVIRQLHATGLTRIGIARVDDSFGLDVEVGALMGMAQIGLKAQFTEKFDRVKWDFSKVAANTEATKAQAVLVAGASKAVVDAVAAIKANSPATLVVTLSNNASQGFVESLGKKARGVMVSQVFPKARVGTTRFAREALATAAEVGFKGELTPANLEGYAAARVLVAALRKAAKPVTGESLQRALDSLGSINMGGLIMDFSSTDHTGLSFVEMSIIDGEGQFLR
ncbi:MAG: ABC transporter substrate-binding protein [Hydrogenophaga sp.]